MIEPELDEDMDAPEDELDFEDEELKLEEEYTPEDVPVFDDVLSEVDGLDELEEEALTEGEVLETDGFDVDGVDEDP